MGRYSQGGIAALADRSSRPKRLWSKLTEQNIRSIQSLRETRLTGDEIAERLICVIHRHRFNLSVLFP